MRQLLLVLTLVLVLVPTAAAATKPPITSIFLRFDTQQAKPRTHSCAKGGPQKQVKLPGSRATGDLAHKAVVACEQPPRSQPFVTSLKHAETAALLALVG